MVAGFVHEVSPILENHPGGRALLAAAVGKDATAPFFGGVYEHSNAAKNVSGCFRQALPPFAPPACRPTKIIGPRGWSQDLVSNP